MQVSSASTASPANIPLSLQSSGLRSNVERTVTGVGPRTGPQEYVPAPPTPPRPSRIDLDEGTEKRMGRIKEVQVAFRAALNMANSIEDQLLLDPII